MKCDLRLLVKVSSKLLRTVMKNIKFTAEPGDLIVIPADQRHLFYLTAKKSIRCIRLFKNTDGWEAIY